MAMQWPGMGGGGLGATMGQGVTWTPQQILSYYEQLANSPQGQAAARASQQTAQLNIRQVLSEIEARRKQLEISQGTAKANAWAQREQIKLAQQAHELAVRQFEVNSTGYYNGSPTMARQAMEGQMTGYFGNNPTLSRQQFEAGTTGYYGGAPTLAREQSQAGTALQAAQIGAGLRGPRNWATYLRSAYDVANSPASAFVAGGGGLGAGGAAPAQRMTLADLLRDFGMGGGPGAAGGGQAVQTGGATGRSADFAGQPGANGTVGTSGGASAPNLGLNPGETELLQNYFNSPNQAPAGWWEGQGEPRREYLRGLMDEWGYDPATFEHRYGSTRPRQGPSWMA